jgi:hypothetical protein
MHTDTAYERADTKYSNLKRTDTEYERADTIYCNPTSSNNPANSKYVANEQNMKPPPNISSVAQFCCIGLF